jgi:hypothetical protein
MDVAIDLSRTPPAVELLEPGDFKSFRVTIAGAAPGDTSGLADALAPYGRLDGDHVLVQPDGVRALAGDRATDPEWQKSLDGMLGYAASKGWVDETGAIQAHCEWLA